MQLSRINTVSPYFQAQKRPAARNTVGLQQAVPVAKTTLEKTPKQGVRFSGFLNKLYNEFVAEPLAGYRKIEDRWGELQSPAGSGNGHQSRTGKDYKEFPTSFHNAGLKHVDFNHSKFPHAANFKKSVCEVVDFSHCDMPAANFEGSVLNGSDFIGARLPGANFSECDLEKLEGTKGDVETQFWKNVTDRHGGNLYASTTREFSGFHSTPDWFYQSSFENADLVAANFENSDLKKVNFRNANLRHANFNKARLQNADLTGARLLGANFRNAVLDGTKVNLIETLEREIQAGNGGVQAYINLGELLHTSGLKLNIHNKKTAEQIQEIFEVRDKGKITQSELERSFLKHFSDGEDDELPISEMLPYVFNKVHQDLL